MTTPIILPKLPRPNSAGHHYIGDHELRARDLEVARVVLEGAEQVADACTAATIRNLEVKHYE
jgi:hypothetical protein